MATRSTAERTSRCIRPAYYTEARRKRSSMSCAHLEVGCAMRKKILIVAGATVALALITALALIGPRNIVGMLRYDIRSEGALKVGDRAPDVELVALDGARVRLKDRLGARPAVLVFGSFT